jgi:peroxiredoxin
MEPTAWINTSAVKPKDLHNKVVLVYFFSFGDEMSEPILSHLSYLWRKLKGKDLMIIGVHAPSLEKEKKEAFVRSEVKKYGLEFPVAVDNDFSVWKAFRNQFYNQFHFVDIDGIVRHTRSGEEIAEEVEMAIVHLLNEAGKKVDLGPEIDGVCLEGDWYVGDGYVELESSSGVIDLRYIGQGVDLVLSSPRERKVEIKLDSEPINKSIAGVDVILEQGKSYLLIDKEKHHQVVREKRKVMREVHIKVRGKGLRLIGFRVIE